ncbi:MAG TPA: diaminopimelate epimerase [Actinomycetes bacterium]|nr:diaminopimelate epimerase [Actinomycetes bacterium]
MAWIRFFKGHGTENDFILLPDPDGTLNLTPEQVRALCDRRAGVGADGVLRVVRSVHAPAGVDTEGTDWFMDHRNADGSTAEMCGNGIRLYVRYLDQSGLMRGKQAAVATRAGVRQVRVGSGKLTVEMGPASPAADTAVEVTVGDRTWPATGVLVPNPHAVVFVDDLADAGKLADPPGVSPPGVFADGVNVEFVVERGPGHIALRVHERGVGETRSCGTGACAAAWAWRRRTGEPTSPGTVRVDVPGGSLSVTERSDGELELTGPAVLVAEGTIDPEWWERLR